MVDIDAKENAALDAASALAGEYLESLSATDLRAFTAEQWRQLLQVIIGGYTEELARIEANECPF
jgi:hypothetical protein